MACYRFAWQPLFRRIKRPRRLLVLHVEISRLAAILPFRMIFPLLPPLFFLFFFPRSFTLPVVHGFFWGARDTASKPKGQVEQKRGGNRSFELEGLIRARGWGESIDGERKGGIPVDFAREVASICRDSSGVYRQPLGSSGYSA